jgi:hypothetical protein
VTQRAAVTSSTLGRATRYGVDEFHSVETRRYLVGCFCLSSVCFVWAYFSYRQLKLGYRGTGAAAPKLLVFFFFGGGGRDARRSDGLLGKWFYRESQALYTAAMLLSLQHA